MALGFAGGARADLHMTYTQQTSVTPTGVSVRDIAVNRNVGSPFYGYVYVADANAYPGSTPKVRILRPMDSNHGTGGANLVDTGLTISASAGTNNTFGVAVGADDTVWIGVFSSGNVETGPPIPSTGTDVQAVKQFSVTGGIRGIGVSGAVDDAKIWIQTTDVKAKYWTGGATDWSSAGSFTENKVFDLKTISSDVQIGYGLGVDSDGNAYVGLSYNAAGANLPVVAKVKTDGTLDSSWGGKRPPFTTIANSLADAEVVEDSRLPGGGYVYYSARQMTNGVAKRLMNRYRLDNGEWMDSFGPPAAGTYAPPTDATYTVLDGVDNSSSPYYFTADDKGNLYLNTAAQSKVTKIAASQSYLVASGAKGSAGGVIKSSPTVVDGITYFGADDGKLYAYTVADGNPVAGFPVDITAAIGHTVKLQGRPAVYYTTAGMGIYFTTDKGDLGRVDADGSHPTFVNPGGLGDGTTSMPAVMSDGTVFIGSILPDGRSTIFRVPADFNPANVISLPLGVAGTSITSPAVYGNKVYVGVAGGGGSALWSLSASDLTTMAVFATGEGVTAPPYINGADAFFGTVTGHFYKVNSATGALDSTFGTGGGVDLGAPISTSPFVPQFGPFLIGTDEGKIFVVSPADGSGGEFVSTGETGNPISGLVATEDGLGFGTVSGAFFLTTPNGTPMQVYRGHGEFTGMPAYDRDTKQFVAASADGNVYAFPAIEPQNLPM